MQQTDWPRYDPANRRTGVLVIYTGGTIGSMPRDPGDPDSPRVVVSWPEFRARTSSLAERLADGSVNTRYIGFNVDGCSIEPLDSCNIGPGQWAQIARIIEESYEHYHGFVVLHGTDTMVYTASALSFMLENLAKPVILTGALRSHLSYVRNDSLQNLLTALLVANPEHSGLPRVPEVCILFNNKLLRGNRARKVHASGFDAFQSPNFPVLAVAGETVEVDTKQVRTADVSRPLRARTRLEPHVALVSFFPGIQDSDMLRDVLSDPGLRGVVLAAYGTGNVPTDRRVLGEIESATRRGVVAVAVTQCGGGQVDLELYDSGVRLEDAGVVSGADITPEAALAKLIVLLGEPDLAPDDVRGLVQQDLCGEQSRSVFVTPLGGGQRLDASQTRLRLVAREFAGGDSIAAVDRVLVRFHRARVMSGTVESVELSLYFDLAPEQEPDRSSRNWLGTWRPRAGQEPTTVLCDITARCRQLLHGRASDALGQGRPVGTTSGSRCQSRRRETAPTGTGPAIPGAPPLASFTVVLEDAGPGRSIVWQTADLSLHRPSA